MATTFLTAWSAWTETTSGNTIIVIDTGTLTAGTNRSVVMEVFYERNEGAFTPFNPTVDYGGQSSYKVEDYHDPTDTVHLYRHWFNETAIANKTDNDITWTGAANGVKFYRWAMVDGTDQFDPVPSSDYTGCAFYATGQNHDSNTVTGNANEVQSCVWGHALRVTSARTFTLDTDWDNSGGNNYSPSGINGDYGDAIKATGGETQYNLFQVESDGSKTFISVFQVKSAVTSPVVTDVNGDDNVDDGRDISGNTDTRNVVTGDNLSNLTGASIDGVAQDDFEVISNTEVRFSTVINAGTDLTFGANTLTLSGDPGGDITHSITLLPPQGHLYGTVASYPPSAGTRDAFLSTGATAVNGNQYSYKATTTLGWGCTVNANGSYTISGGGTDTQSITDIRVYVSGQWSDRGTVNVNAEPVLESVAGATADSGTVDLNDTDILLIGDQFGDEQFDFKVYLCVAPANNVKPVDDGTWEEQTDVISWSNDQILLGSLRQGSLPGATKLAFIVGRKA